MVANDLNDIGPNMRLEQRGSDRSMASVAEHLADVMQQPREHNLLVGAGALRSAGQLERMVELTNGSAVTHVLKAGKECQHLFGPPSGATEPVHPRMLAQRLGYPDVIFARRTAERSSPGARRHGR